MGTDRILRGISSEPELPVVDRNWRSRHPIGSVTDLVIYVAEEGWKREPFEILHYFPHIVKCRDSNGFIRCFDNWEFQKRQTQKVDTPLGRKSKRGEPF